MAGTEFMQERWYPDVQLDNIFWHDHVDGIHSWGHGLVGQLIIEPKDSTYHDPTTGEPVDSGTFVDIHTNQPVAQGLINGSFRELALWELDESPVTDSTLNLRAEPFANRPGDPSQLFSSYAHGDPHTKFVTEGHQPVIPQAYPGDPFVIRTINVGPSVDTFHVDGHRFFDENRFLDSASHVIQKPKDTLHIGVSERFTSILEGGAGGVKQRPGDYLFFNGISRRFQQGAWSLLRVLDGKATDLQPLPGHPAPANDATVPTGTTPPADSGPGNPCPAGAPDRTIAVSTVDVRSANKGEKSVFVQTSSAASAQRNGVVEPFVAHVATGDCLTVNFTNQRATARSSFHVSKLDHTVQSSGVDVGYNPEQTVAPGAHEDLPLLRRRPQARQRAGRRHGRPGQRPARSVRRDRGRPAGREVHRPGDRRSHEHRRRGRRPCPGRAGLPRLHDRDGRSGPDHRRQLHALPRRRRRTRRC